VFVGWAAFGETPAQLTAVGGAFILAAGVYVVRRS
jgi:drug/metabolite transporter (DMT)-like permease